MSFSEGVSDTGEDTGRGNPRVRGAITGTGTFIGGFLHTLPFLIPSYTTAIVVAILVVMLKLGTLASCGCGSSTRASAPRCSASRSQVRSSLQRVRRLGPPLADESWLDLMIGMEAAIRWPPSGGLSTRRLPSRTASRSFSPTSRKAVSRYFDLDGDRHPGSECRAHPTAAARNAADDELWVIY
jgi:hypothetical protein